MTESAPLKNGDAVLFWPDKRPLVRPLSAKLMKLSEDGKTALVEVVNPAKKTKYLVNECAFSDIATPRSFTRTGVALGGEFDRSDKRKLENAGKAAKQAAEKAGAALAPSGSPAPAGDDEDDEEPSADA